MAMEPINNVRIGNYSIGNPQGGAARKSESEAGETQTQNQQAQSQNFDVDNYFNALGMVGAQNMAFISKTDKVPNPSDYLSDERISDIEAMMAEFDFGVESYANTIEAEFPGMFDEASKNALAAQIFAAE